MDTETRARENDTISERIIGCAQTVADALGPGSLERVYEDALVLELRKAGLQVEQQRVIEVSYDSDTVGIYTVDLLVEKHVIVEVKAANHLDNTFMARCVSYLKTSGLKLCLLINFGAPEIQVERISL